MEATGALHADSGGEMGLRLSKTGKAHALEASQQSEYFGALPVPLTDCTPKVRTPSLQNLAMTRDLLGAAIGSGRSILMCGPPDNGKFSIPNGLRDAIGNTIHVPCALECAGQVIILFDPIVHIPVE